MIVSTIYGQRAAFRLHLWLAVPPSLLTRADEVIEVPESASGFGHAERVR